MGCLSLNSSHKRSISPSFKLRQPARRSCGCILSLFAAFSLAGLSAPVAGMATCSQTLGNPAFAAGPLTVPGKVSVSIRFALTGQRRGRPSP